MKNKMQIMVTGMLLLCASATHAATVTYTLDQSNRFEDGIDYVSVSLTEDSAQDVLNISVAILPALAGYTNEHTGIQAFAFNLGEGVRIGHGRHRYWCMQEHEKHGDRHEEPRREDIGNDDMFGHEKDGQDHAHHHPDNYDPGDFLTRGDFGLPDGWRVKLNKGWDWRLMYDVLVFGKRGQNQDPLQFSIEGLTLDDISNEFAVLITGLDLGGGECGHHEGEREHGHHGKCMKRRNSAFFYGGGDPSPIPVPAALWLFGSGLLGLVGVARRRQI